MRFLSRMMDAKDHTVDSLVFFGLVGVLALIGFSGYDLVVYGHGFSPVSFSTGFSVIIGSVGIGVGVRGKLSPLSGQQDQQQGDPQCSGSPAQSLSPPS